MLIPTLRNSIPDVIMKEKLDDIDPSTDIPAHGNIKRMEPGVIDLED